MIAQPHKFPDYRFLVVEGAVDFKRNLREILECGEFRSELPWKSFVECERGNACEVVKDAAQRKTPFSVAFVQSGPPPEFPGLETVEGIWKCDKDLQVVVCSENINDHWMQIRSQVSQAERLTMLDKPLQKSTVQQITCSLCEKWTAIIKSREVVFEKAAQLQEAQESLRIQERHLELASRLARVGYGSLDLATQVLELSGNACRILDLEVKEDYSVSDLVNVLPNTDRVKLQLMLDEAIYREKDFEHKFRFHHPDGEFQHIVIQVICDRDANSAKTSLFFVIRDVTKEENVLQAVQHASLHDTLTGLPNRAKFQQQLEMALKHSRRNQSGTGLILLDLDRFKEINDSYGHPVGDGLLKEFAARVSGCAREVDTVARLGGDEFAIVQMDAVLPQDSLTLLERIYREVSKPFNINGKWFYASFSSGVALAPANGNDVDTILKNADLALYRAKREGRGVYRFFDSEMDESLRDRMQIESDLKHALNNDEFVLHYQPIVCTATQKISTMETLIRWTHPARGQVQPDRFIEIAESTATIIPIGEWILMQACTDALNWPEEVGVSVNVSAVQLQRGDFSKTVQKVLDQTRLAPTRLEIEITETVFLNDSEETLSSLNTIREMGVRIAMDDFGIGYSSLSYLRNFPFDKIKLDKSFVDTYNEPESRAIICAVAGMGQSLGMLTCAEGVETPEQYEVIRKEGYTHVQGYLFGRPQMQTETLTLFGDPKALGTTDSVN